MFNALNHNPFQLSRKLSEGKTGNFFGRVLLVAAFLAVYGLLIWLIRKTVIDKIQIAYYP